MHSREPRLVQAILALAIVVSVAVPTAAGTPSPFTEEAVGRGINFPMSAYPQVQGYVGQGAGFVDLDSDGDADIVLIGRISGVVGIYENNGSGMFTDHSATTGIAVMVQQEGFAAADYDADGYLDLYLTQANNRFNYLYKNNGNFTFTDKTTEAGVSNGSQNSTSPTWGDFNNDGWLDIYVSNYGQGNGLYRNNGESGTFSNLAASLGVTGGTALSFQNLWTDFDRDGDVDLYLSNDRGPLGFPANALWRNDNGLFVDVSAGSGADVSIYSMGIGAGDIDNNLYADIYVTNINAIDSSGGTLTYDGINPLLLNQGDDTFIEDSETWAVDNRKSSWAANFFDWDNDGFKDLYVVNQFEPNSFFECGGTPVCTEMANQLGIEATYDPEWDLIGDPPTIATYNSAVADVDGDGDLDLLTSAVGHRAELFINHEGENRSWVRMDLVGEHPNLFAIGGNVEVTSGGITQFYESYAGGNGYQGQNELTFHVGLGQAAAAEQVVAEWPSGGPDRTLTNLPAGNTWKIYPPSQLCDADNDGVDYDDFVEFAACFAAGFSNGCEMMDFDGDSVIYDDDLGDCFVTSPADCNANGTEDLVEIMLDLGLDVDQNYLIDCCETGTPDDPNDVDDTLFLTKNGSGQPVLSWTAPPTDGTHGAATAYDVFAGGAAPGPFGLLASVGPTTHTDASGAPGDLYYVVSARNGCGSSGEEPF